MSEDYSGGRDEYRDGWKDGWLQVLREWDSVVSLVKNSTKRRSDLDIGPILFEACRATAAAYRTRKGSWDAGRGMLLTYAREWATIPAIQAEIRNQLNGASADDKKWSSALEEAGMPPPEVEPEYVAVDVPQAIPAPDRACLMCGKDITHLSLDARFCKKLCS